MKILFQQLKEKKIKNNQKNKKEYLGKEVIFENILNKNIVYKIEKYI